MYQIGAIGKDDAVWHQTMDGEAMSPTIKAGLYYWWQFHTSHFETPKGVSVWLATFV